MVVFSALVAITLRGELSSRLLGRSLPIFRPVASVTVNVEIIARGQLLRDVAWFSIVIESFPSAVWDVNVGKGSDCKCRSACPLIFEAKLNGPAVM